MGVPGAHPCAPWETLITVLEDLVAEHISEEESRSEGSNDD